VPWGLCSSLLALGSPCDDVADPLADIATSSRLAALPKADLHVHQEWFARLDRVLARREGRSFYDWRGWACRLIEEVPSGMPRLRRLATVRPVVKGADADPENFVARVEAVKDLLSLQVLHSLRGPRGRCGRYSHEIYLMAHRLPPCILLVPGQYRDAHD
jgi:hypothetical protein